MNLDKDSLKNGPVMKRSCTDIFCCLVFLMFIVGLIGVSIYGFMNGNPNLLLTAWDYDGNLFLLFINMKI